MPGRSLGRNTSTAEELHQGAREGSFSKGKKEPTAQELVGVGRHHKEDSHKPSRNRNSPLTSEKGLGRRKTARLQRADGGPRLFSKLSFKRKERKWATAKEGYRTEKRFFF